MPQNKKESLVFTILMCAFMVFIMSVYNLTLHMGLSIQTIKNAWIGFPFAFLFAILIDMYVVSGVAKKIAFKFLKPDSKTLTKIIAISSCMVCGMVLFMSFYGAFLSVGLTSALFMAWIKNIPVNFIMALPLQLLIAGPIVRFVFRRTFPVGCITVDYAKCAEQNR